VLCTSFLWPNPPHYQDPSHVAQQWVSRLEQEAGVGDWPRTSASEGVLATGVAGPGPSTISRRHHSTPTRCQFPDFYVGSYEDALRAAQADAVALCVILLSNEHDDVGYFIRYVCLILWNVLA
jgi:FAS-associated factor 2